MTTREEEPEFIVAQVVRVSVKTVKIVEGLPGEFEPGVSVRPPGEKG